MARRFIAGGGAGSMLNAPWRAAAKPRPRGAEGLWGGTEGLWGGGVRSEAEVVGRRDGGGEQVGGGADGDADVRGRVRRKGEGRAQGEDGGVAREC